MDIKKHQESLLKHMAGKWELQKENLYINITISKFSTTIILDINGKKEEIDGAGDWFGDFHYFVNESYYILLADETNLKFGKNKIFPDAKGLEWEYVFTRVKVIEN